jgi:hypothetical protein
MTIHGKEAKSKAQPSLMTDGRGEVGFALETTTTKIQCVAVLSVHSGKTFVLRGQNLFLECIP